MSLLNLIRTGRTRDRETSLTAYRDLLAKGENATPQDAASLNEVADILGKSIDDIANDLAVLHEASRLKSLVDSLQALEAARTAARDECRAFKVSAEQRIRELETEMARLAGNEYASGEKCLRAQRAAGQLSDIENSRPDLFPK